MASAMSSRSDFCPVPISRADGMDVADARMLDEKLFWARL